ncbi:MAG: heliorhodopsin HeR [Bacilli bacterium]|nr:heliorhodopsin HeR [Bacilli bacterium]
MKDKYEKLIKFNRNMGFLHLIQAIIMLLLATSVISKIAEFSPTITKLFIEYNTATQSLQQASKPLFDLPFGILVSMFLFISAFAHFFIVYKKEKYVEGLKEGINKFRWIEYALSSSIMIVLIATLFGVYDISSLILIFVVNALMNIFGLVMEQLNKGEDKKKVNWEPFLWGTIAGLTPWIVILIYMFGNGNLDMVPWFVWAIVATYFVAFNTFPINMILQYKKVGKWKDYLYGERVYIILSLVAKTALAWLVLFGAMQP